jgi:hypothetical protein
MKLVFLIEEEIIDHLNVFSHVERISHQFTTGNSLLEIFE